MKDGFLVPFRRSQLWDHFQVCSCDVLTPLLNRALSLLLPALAQSSALSFRPLSIDVFLPHSVYTLALPLSGGYKSVALQIDSGIFWQFNTFPL